MVCHPARLEHAMLFAVPLFEGPYVGQQVGDGVIRHAVDQTAWHEGGGADVLLLANGALGDVGDHATLVGDTRAAIVLSCFEPLGDQARGFDGAEENVGALCCGIRIENSGQQVLGVALG